VVQVSLDSGKNQPDIGFKLSDSNCNGVEYIASVHNQFVGAAKVAGIWDFVESLNAVLCTTLACHKRAMLIIERIVELAKEPKTYTQTHNYLTTAPRFAISILKTLVKLVDNCEPTVYGRVLEGEGNISKHKWLEELLLAMDKECANKATVKAVFQMFTKLLNLDRDATWPGKKQGPGNHPNISATSGHGGARGGKGKGGDGGNGKGRGDDCDRKSADKTNKGSVCFKELPKECLLCSGDNHTIKECPYKHEGPRRNLAKKLEEGKELCAQKRTEKLTPASAKLLNNIYTKAEELASRAARAEAKDTTVQTPAARNFGLLEYWDSDYRAICEDTECPVDWVDATKETVGAGATTGPFGYVSAAITKTARATAEGFIGSVVKIAGSVTACLQKVSTGKVVLHPDSAKATPMLKDE
jgi:hypothetical protein